ncbi:hypothetical protein GMORB2_2350 [Geosmithia morbida]|uniref:Rhodopsin domain-containing protein n=1 Tax=Geosmithia morbida TaxID=1094350 RepID=A0A9P4YSA2_9HYPO|nr:uncharacterized protein GMORB2_2350 [Geosmithia morbida]KAF4120864.1 hypothetical protein GMORB2_2350 [Geosmithia morbida]
MAVPAMLEARDDLHANRGPELTSTTIIVLVLSFVFVGLRFWSRYIRTGYGLDDWLTVAALAFVCVCSGLNFASKFNSQHRSVSDLTIAVVSYGLGKHAAIVPADDLVMFLKLLLSFECMYVTAVMFVKLSLLQMYLRIFPGRRFKIWAAIIAAIVIGWWISIVAVSVFQCNPIKKAWFPLIDGTCINLKASFIGNAIPNIGTDVAILCMPMTQIWRLHINLAQKLSLCVMFLLGSLFTTIMQFVPADTTWTLATACTWCVVEAACGTIAVCLPTLRPLMQQLTVKFDSMTNSKGKSSGRGETQPTELMTIGGTGGTKSRQNFQRLNNEFNLETNHPNYSNEGSTTAQNFGQNDASSGDEVPLHKEAWVATTESLGGKK